MRWNDLFGDLEGQLDAAHAADFATDVYELAQAERAGVDLGDRLLACPGREVHVVLRGGERVVGVVSDASREWLLLGVGGREHLVPRGAMVALIGAPERTVTHGGIERRLTLGHALRGLARGGETVRVLTTAGDYRGRMAWVGADHIDLVQELGDRTVAIAFAEILCVTPA